MDSRKDSVKCLRDIRGVPPNVYELPEDGRQKRHLSQQRRNLAWLLATYADSDGTSIRPSTFTMARELGVSRRTVVSLMADLRDGLGFVDDAGFYATGEIHTRQRVLNVAKILAAAAARTAQSSQKSTVQSSATTAQSTDVAVRNVGESTAQSSPRTAQSCYCAQPPALPASITAHQPPPQINSGWWRRFITTAMNMPGKNQQHELEAMAAQHGSEISIRAVELLLERGLGDARNPWAVFIAGAEGWIQKAAQEKHDAIRKTKEREIIEAHCVRQALEFSEFMRKEPAAQENGGSAEEYFADLQ